MEYIISNVFVFVNWSKKEEKEMFRFQHESISFAAILPSNQVNEWKKWMNELWNENYP